jgi:hypothetical protein
VGTRAHLCDEFTGGELDGFGAHAAVRRARALRTVGRVQLDAAHAIGLFVNEDFQLGDGRA